MKLTHLPLSKLGREETLKKINKLKIYEKEKILQIIGKKIGRGRKIFFEDLINY